MGAAAALLLSACSGDGGSSTAAATAPPTITQTQSSLIRECLSAEAASSGSADTLEVYRTDWGAVGGTLHVPTSSTGTDPVYLVWMTGHFRDDSGAG
jgi:hypothetical protein